MARIKITAGATAGGTARAATHYGVRPAEEEGLSAYNVAHGHQKLQVTATYEDINNDLYKNSIDKLYQSLPATAVVRRAVLYVKTTFVSPTTPTLRPQLVDSAGSFVADLHAAAITEATLTERASIEADGSAIDGNGISVETFLDLNSSATDWTAGELVYEIEFQVY